MKGTYYQDVPQKSLYSSSSDAPIKPRKTHPLPSAQGNPFPSLFSKPQLSSTLQDPDPRKIEEDSRREDVKENPLSRSLSTGKKTTEPGKEAPLEDSLRQGVS